jgi:hypothetical protein
MVGVIRTAEHGVLDLYSTLRVCRLGAIPESWAPVLQRDSPGLGIS